MAVSKLWPVTVRLATVLDYASNPEKTTKSKSKYSDADYQALRDVVAYAKDGEKTERELFCEGIHCNPQTAREQFITVKEQFDKPDGIQAYHGYLSFEETDITPELAQQVGMAFAERMWGDRFQVLVTTHLNTEHEIVAVFRTVVYTDSPEAFKFYRFIDAESANEFDDFIAKCKELSFYDTGVTAEYGDKLITLSTCEYSRNNSRLVVVAKHITEDGGADAAKPHAEATAEGERPN